MQVNATTPPPRAEVRASATQMGAASRSCSRTRRAAASRASSRCTGSAPRSRTRVRCAKASGLRNLPFRAYAMNAAWLELVRIGIDLLAWTRRLLLAGGSQRLAQDLTRSCVGRGCVVTRAPPLQATAP